MKDDYRFKGEWNSRPLNEVLAEERVNGDRPVCHVFTVGTHKSSIAF